ncbi:MAG: pyruvate kinase [Bacillota bacterium]
MRKTKIVCTLGPAVDDLDSIRQLITEGMDVARLNFSHGSHQEHKARADKLKQVREEMGKHVPLLMDMKGPEIRTGSFKDGLQTLQAGQLFTFTPKDVEGDSTIVTITYNDLYKDVFPGAHVSVDDGHIDMVVEEIRGEDIVCRVSNGGQVSNHKGVNVPGVMVNVPIMEQSDIDDIAFAVENDFDFIAVSFVRDADDIRQVRSVLNEKGGKGIRLIAKIETAQGVNNIDSIIAVSDGIMVARGDLGVELPIERVPIVQKELIKKCYESGKPVITATQMLDSMIRNPRPTRAEANDVANAIFEGTSAIMLSGETAAGRYPIESLQMMVRIAEAAEESMDYKALFKSRHADMSFDVANAISHATCTTAMDLNATAIVTVTKSGITAQKISRFRPHCPIIAATTSKKVMRQLWLSWGILPCLSKEACSAENLLEIGVETALNSHFINTGDLVVITAGVPIGVSGTTNMLKVHIAGNPVLK